MDSNKINYVLPDDILDIIWKNYYSQYILPIISNRKESQLYLYFLDESPIPYIFAMNPLSYQPSSSVNLSKILLYHTEYITNI